ncbi:MAG: L,D-transpeptidase family protein [Gammaproteobacteria bacterium]|nr:L,D-transpeptidase family protein [Gammaproteobacteria bacterium]
MRKSILHISCLLAALASSGTHASIGASVVQERAYEDPLIQALQAIDEYRTDDALSHLEKLLKETPDFTLAQLVYADMLAARTGAVTQLASSEQHDELLADLRNEARARLNFHLNQNHQQQLPKSLLRLAPRYKHVILVDAKQSRLFLYENTEQGLQLRYNTYATIGKNGANKWREGDKRTPIGVYFVTDFLPPSSLSDFYGAGAFPINYPNAWDRRLGRTGYGIWLHGNPIDSFSRAPQASDGCVTINNDDLEYLKQYIDTSNTPVIISNGVEWSDAAALSSASAELEQQLIDWQNNWQSMNDSAFLQHYSKNFVSSTNQNLATWKRNKSWSNQQKNFIEIKVDEVSMFLYPGEKDMALVDFKQHYRSDSYQDVSIKRQYWKREKDGRWRIIYEGPAS